MMKFEFTKHVSVVCDLSIDDKVMVKGFGYRLDNKICIIKDIKPSFGSCESGVLVKINCYENYLDSNWIVKLNKEDYE